MTYETTIAGENFFPFVKAATDFVGDAKVIFEDDIIISSLDTAGVLLVDTAVRNPCPPQTPIEVLLDLRSIAGVTSVKNDVTFILDGSSRVVVKTGRMQYVLPTIVDAGLKNRRMPDKTFDVRLSINAAAFVEGVQGMLDANKSIEEMMGFWFIAESPEVFYFQDRIKQYAKAVFSHGDEYTVDIFEKPAASMFSVDYVEDMIKHIKKFDTVKLCLNTDDPMILVCANTERKLAYALAARIEND